MLGILFPFYCNVCYVFIVSLHVLGWPTLVFNEYSDPTSCPCVLFRLCMCLRVVHRVASLPLSSKPDVSSELYARPRFPCRNRYFEERVK